MLRKKIKVISEEPKDNDKTILFITIFLLLIIWYFIGFMLYKTGQSVATPLFTLILATVTVIATFQNEIKNWWKKPKIKLIPHAEHSIKKTMGMWFFRIKVRNFGRGSAKNSQIKLTQVFDMNTYRSITDQINLGWSGVINEAGYEKHLEKKDLHSHGRDFFDLFIIERVLKNKYKLPLENLIGLELEKFKKIFGKMPFEEKFIPNKFNMYLVGSNGETRKLELGGTNYLIYITLYSEGDYSKEFMLKICNSENPNNVRVESVINKKQFNGLLV